MSQPAYPLAWPSGWPRSPEHERDRARFGVRVSRSGGYATMEPLTLAEGCARVLDSLRRLGAIEHTIVISSDVPLRRDGLPMSSAREPADPGVAVYWTLDNPECMALDRYTRLADNVAAVAATIEAMRMIERHGGSAIMRRAFQGFRQIAAQSGVPDSLESAWATLFKLAPGGAVVPPALRDGILAQDVVRVARGATHPDRNNGDASNFHLVQLSAEILSRAYGRKL